MGKNKNKGGKPQQNKPKVNAPVQKITPEVEESAKNLEQKVGEKLSAEGLVSGDAEQALSPEAQTKLENAERKEDIAGYLQYLRSINVNQESLQKRLDETKEKIESAKAQLEIDKKEFEDSKKSFKEKQAEQNKRDEELSARERDLAYGELSSVVKTVLDKMRKAEQDIFEDAGRRVEELAEIHTKTMDRISESQKESDKLAEDRLALEDEKKKFKRERLRFESERKMIEEDIKEDLERTYSEQQEKTNGDLERQKEACGKLQSENQVLRSELEKIQAAFDKVPAEQMVQRIDFYKKQAEQFKQERDQMVDPEVHRSFVLNYQELEKRCKELTEKETEKSLAELQAKLSAENNYSILRERHRLEMETARIKAENQEAYIKKLNDLVKQLQEDSTKNNVAFEYALQVDSDTVLQNPRAFYPENPSNLAELVSYLQGRMRSSSDEKGQRKAFYYDSDTIRIFLAGLNMSPISILWGISGTGKTSLPREFAKALMESDSFQGLSKTDKSPNAPYRICAVQSGWRDNMDLMGYYNSFEKKYKETDFFKALYVANQPKYKDTLFFIILDEMNLSRPEHYFADFLSLLEQSEDQRYITVNAPIETWKNMKSMEGGKLHVPENVRFIGTANHDETTLEFAPKTYDRSNVMEMPINISKEGDVAEAEYNISYSWIKKQFEEAKTVYRNSFLSFKSFIDSDDFKLLIEDKNIGIGNRFESQAERFITTFMASGSNSDDDLAKAADHLITSRLFRSLKDRYELNKENLQNFKDAYEKAFRRHFGFLPTRANEMLRIEIDKKNN